MLAKAAKVLNGEQLINKWNVDLESEDKMLSISGEDITPDIITKALSQAGFKSEIIRVQAIGGHDL